MNEREEDEENNRYWEERERRKLTGVNQNILMLLNAATRAGSLSNTSADIQFAIVFKN